MMAKEETTAENNLVFQCPDLVCSSVTVYADRAEVKRVLKAFLKAGTNEVIVKKLPASIDHDSIRVEGRGAATICEVQYQDKFVKREEDTSVKQKELENLIRRLKESQTKIAKELERTQKKRKVVDGIADQLAQGGSATSEGGKEKAGFALSNEALSNVDKFLDFYDERVLKLDDAIQQTEARLGAVREELRVAETNLRALRPICQEMSREVSILLEAAEPEEIQLNMSYVVYEARWTPSYDVRVFTQDKAMKVHYYGMITQNSGEDWTDTQLSLSTATPSIGGVVPELRTLRISVYKPPPPPVASYAKHRMMKGGGRTMMMKALGSSLQSRSEAFNDDESYEVAEAMSAPMMREATVEVQDSVISTSFEIGRKGSIPSDNAQHKVNVTIIDLQPSFQYETVPSKTPYAFLIAKVVNKSVFPLLAGPVSVFLDNNFVANSALKAVSPNEDFTVSLGIDPAVRVTYKPVNKFTEQAGFWNKHSTTMYEQNIVLKNTRNEEIKIRLTEHIPLSDDEKVKVVVIEPHFPKSEVESKKLPYHLNQFNNLVWDMSVSAQAEHTVLVKYSVDCPPGGTVLNEDPL